MKKYLIVGGISLAVGSLITLISFKGCEKPNGVIQSDTVTVVSYIHHHDTIEISKPYAQTIIKDSIIKDTVQVLIDYLTEKRYKLPYSDTNINFNANICIFKNELKSFDFEYLITQREKIITNTKYKDEFFSLQLGGGFLYNFANKQYGITAGVGANIKSVCLSADYDIINQSIIVNCKHKVFTINK